MGTATGVVFDDKCGNLVTLELGGEYMDEEIYNFLDFIERVKDMDYKDIMNYGDREIARMERISYLNPGDENNINTENKKYSDQIKAFLLFMSQGIKPVGVSLYDFRLYRIVVEYLVAKEQMKPETIEIFINQK
jgi:hypothetical protein